MLTATPSTSANVAAAASSEIESGTSKDIIVEVLGVAVSMSGRLVEVRVDQPTVAVHRLTGWAIEQSVELEGLSVRRASLEDVFLELIGEYGVVSGS